MRAVVISIVLVVAILAIWPHAPTDVGAWIGAQLWK